MWLTSLHDACPGSDRSATGPGRRRVAKEWTLGTIFGLSPTRANKDARSRRQPAEQAGSERWDCDLQHPSETGLASRGNGHAGGPPGSRPRSGPRVLSHSEGSPDIACRVDLLENLDIGILRGHVALDWTPAVIPAHRERGALDAPFLVGLDPVARRLRPCRMGNASSAGPGNPSPPQPDGGTQATPAAAEPIAEQDLLQAMKKGLVSVRPRGSATAGSASR